MAGSNKTSRVATDRDRARLGTVLVPTDFSQESLKAVRYAVALLRQFGGELHLVHVHDVDYSYAVPPIVAVPPMITAGELEAYCRGELQRLAAEHVTGNLPRTLHCATGRAFHEICKLAEEIDADLVVISTHGRTGLPYLVLGSTTERVVRHSPCPVLVVREVEKDFVAASADSPLQVKKIMAPVDFSDCSVQGLRYAISFAKRCGATLDLVHAIHVQPFIPAERFTAYSREPSPGVIERAAKMQMHKLVKAVDFEGVPHEARIEIGVPSHKLCEVAKTSGADLIIIPTHGLTGIRHVFLGSTAEHVVRYAPCPVIVVPTRSQSA